MHIRYGTRVALVLEAKHPDDALFLFVSLFCFLVCLFLCLSVAGREEMVSAEAVGRLGDTVGQAFVVLVVLAYSSESWVPQPS